MSENDPTVTHALVILVKEMMDQLDEICAIRQSGGGAKIGIELLREMGSVLKDFDPELLSQYFNVLEKLAISVEAPKRYSVSEEYLELVKKKKLNLMKDLRERLKVSNS